jgi:phosphonate transport system substrate-binding protein
MKRTLWMAMIAMMAMSPGGPAASAADPATLIVAFQPQENPEKLQLHADAMTRFLSAELGMAVKVYLPTDYAAVVEALRGNHAHVAYFSAWPYMLAHKLAGATILVAEQRAGQTRYHSHWYALRDGPVASLADARGKRAAFTAPSSTSGYLFPLAKLVEEKLIPPKGNPAGFFRHVVFAGGYEQALKALVNGQVDVAAASDYAFARYLAPEEQARVRIVSQQGPVPTHCIAVKQDLSAALRDRIRAALLQLNEPEHRELLRSVYGAEKFVAVTHAEHTAALAGALELTGLDYPLKRK